MITYFMTQANLFIAGGNAGAAVKMLELDNLKSNTEKLESLGMLFEKDVPTGFGQMAGKLTFAGPAPDYFNQAAFPFENTSLTLLGVMVDKSLTGAAANKQFKIDFQIRPSEIGLGKFENQKLTEFERNFYVDKIKVTMAGVEQLEVDADNNIYRVNGTDKWAEWKTLLGQ